MWGDGQLALRGPLTFELREEPAELLDDERRLTVSDGLPDLVTANQSVHAEQVWLGAS